VSRVFGFLVVIFIACAIIGGLHYYLWARLVRDTQLCGSTRYLAAGIIVGLACTTVASPFAMRVFPGLGRVLVWPGSLWLGIMFILVSTLGVGDLLRLLAGLLGRAWAHNAVIVDQSRRAFNARLLAGAALAATTGLTTSAIRATRGRVAVKRVEIVLDRLPAGADGMRIVQLCDLHVGGLLGKDFVAEVVRTSNELAADVIAIVGDLVDGSIERLRPAIAPIAHLRARHGTFFVTGNHEYYSSSGARAWMDELDRMGLRVLRNQRVAVGTAEVGFDIAGVPDHSATRHSGKDGPQEDVALALAGRDPRRAVVLLAHQPITIHVAARHGVDLQLSGHTHGGQIWPWGLAVRLQQPFIRGLHRLGDTQIYVSCGTGFWGPPMRLGAPAEITEIVLRAKRAPV
jgi:predicted MPP superfamily phosphohydrolase